MIHWFTMIYSCITPHLRQYILKCQRGKIGFAIIFKMKQKKNIRSETLTWSLGEKSAWSPCDGETCNFKDLGSDCRLAYSIVARTQQSLCQ